MPEGLFFFFCLLLTAHKRSRRRHRRWPRNLSRSRRDAAGLRAALPVKKPGLDARIPRDTFLLTCSGHLEGVQLISALKPRTSPHSSDRSQEISPDLLRKVSNPAQQLWQRHSVDIKRSMGGDGFEDRTGQQARSHFKPNKVSDEQ